MNVRKFGIVIVLCFLSACSVKTPIENKYKLEKFCAKKINLKKSTVSVQIAAPVAVSGYNTEQMLYVVQPYELTPFVKNAWVDAPANMLFPLIVQSFQASGYFYAVSSLPYADKTDYRVDTQLIALEQNFLVKPSVLDFVVKNVVTNSKENQIIASRIFGHHLPCPVDGPYGGVMAANEATKLYTAELTQFVINAINQDRH